MENSEDLQELLEGVDSFADAMKKRIAEKHDEGYQGWKTADSDVIIQEAQNRLVRLSQGEIKCDIGLANFMLIHWLNRKK